MRIVNYAPTLCLVVLSACSNSLHVDNLTCDYKENPIAIENKKPALSWQIKGKERNITQSAYQILVSDNKDSLDHNIGNIWDSGSVASSQSVHVIYDGKEPEPYQTYYWKVKIEDQKGHLSDWSPIASWRQVPTDPQLSWIGYADTCETADKVSSIWFRKSFQQDHLPKGPVYADIATPGYYELYINGKKVGTDKISPSCSGKDKRSFYATYDISKYLSKGSNTIGIWLGKGWYGKGPIPVAFRCQLPDNGELLEIQTDSTWKAAPSPYSTLGTWDWANFGGECYDANKEIANWNLTDFDDSAWGNAQAMNQPSPRIEAQPCELNRMDDAISSVSINALDDNIYEIDFGKNLTGLYTIHFPQLQKGDTLRLYFADMRWDSPNDVETPAGTIRLCNMGERLFKSKGDTLRYSTHNQHSMYIASGKQNEVFQSRFNPLGFRYIVVQGLKEEPVMASANMIETDLKRTGEFSCSDTLFNHMHEVDDWTMRCLNQGAVYVDCPTRERLGYGDSQVAVESAIMNYSMPLFYRKFVKDWVLRQDPETGRMPNVAPNYQGGGGIGWAGIVAAATWRCYQYYNDISMLAEIYPYMMKYLESIEPRCVDGILFSAEDMWQSIGDWVAPGRGMDTSNWPSKEMAEFFNNCYRVYLWDLQFKSAKALNKTEDIELCMNKLAEIRPLIHNYYYQPDKGYYVSDEQSYLLMPLMTGVTPDNLKNKLWQKLEDNITTGGKFQTGMFGTYFLLNYLLDNNRNDLVYKLVGHQEYPGWGYMLSQGATTWWEQWNGFWSHIHSCFTSLDSWFYQGIAGIRPLPNSPGMQHFQISPAYNLPLQSASATVQSMYGPIKSIWEKDDKVLKQHIEIPANSSAQIFFPVNDATKITENGKPLAQIEGISNITQSPEGTSFILHSGDYNFKLVRD